MGDSIRKLASVQKILALDPIEGADRIEVATILGWKVVVGKGTYKVGDLCVYFEIDSVLPENILRAANLWDEEKGKGKLSGSNGNRLKTVKLRGQISQGLTIPYSVLGLRPYHDGSGVIKDFEVEGEDLTEVLKIEKYEPPIPAELAGVCKGTFPGFLIKTDSHRLQAAPGLIEEMQGVPCYATVKMDGTSSTFYNRFLETENEFGVCSRNMDLCESDTNMYWRMARKYDLVEKMGMSNMAIQAETFGPGIQGNKMGAEEVQMAVFDMFHIIDYRYVDWGDLKGFCELLELPLVEPVYEGSFEWKSVDELIEFASGIKYSNGAAAEGIVIRPQVEMRSKSLDGGRMAFKVISPEFLAKNKE